MTDTPLTDGLSRYGAEHVERALRTLRHLVNENEADLDGLTPLQHLTLAYLADVDYLTGADKAEAPSAVAATFETAAKAYHDSVNPLVGAAFARIAATILAKEPTAQAYVLVSYDKDDGGMGLKLDEVWIAGAGRCSIDDGNAELIEELEEAVQEPLGYIEDLTGDDYLGQHLERLVDGRIDGLDDDQ